MGIRLHRRMAVGPANRSVAEFWQIDNYVHHPSRLELFLDIFLLSGTTRRFPPLSVGTPLDLLSALPRNLNPISVLVPSLWSDYAGEPAAGCSVGQVKQLEGVRQFGCEIVEDDLRCAALDIYGRKLRPMLHAISSPYNRSESYELDSSQTLTMSVALSTYTSAEYFDHARS